MRSEYVHDLLPDKADILQRRIISIEDGKHILNSEYSISGLDTVKRCLMMKDFVGRKKELIRLEEILKEEKVCIINGLAGIGKTYLAQAFLEQKNCEGQETYYIHYHDPDHFSGLRDKVPCYLVVDDILSIDRFLRSEHFLSISQTSVQNIILITRDSISEDVKIPSITLRPMDYEDTHELIEALWGKKLSGDNEQRIFLLSEGHPLFIYLIFELNKEYPLDEILRLISYPENMEVLARFVKREIEPVFLSRIEFDILLMILTLGDIDIKLLIRWSGVPSCKQIIEMLVHKGIVRKTVDGRIYPHLVTISDYDDVIVAPDLYKDLMWNIKQDIVNGREIDERYPLAIIHRIMKTDDAVDFAATFYENRYEKKDVQFHEDMKSILKELGYIRQRTDIIDVNTRNIDRKVKIVITNQEKIYEIISGLTEVYKDNAEAVQKIDELLEIVKNPSRSKLERANSIIGFLGSIASISSLFGVQTNLSQLQMLISSIY